MNTSIRTHGISSLFQTVATGVAFLTPSATAQPAPEERVSAQVAATESAAEESRSDPLGIFRAPLLREGSHLAELAARMQRDDERRWWKLVIEPTDPNAPRHDLILLPCSTLDRMEHIISSMPGEDVMFLVTGRVTVYRQRNYVLLTHAALVSMGSPTNAILAQPPPSTQPATQPATAADEDSVESIIRNLEAASGPLARSAPPGPDTNVTPREIANGQLSQPSPAPDVDLSVPASSQGTAMFREGTMIVARRGTIRRDDAGAWLFVFDADSTGLADPPVSLLPCLLLERLEESARGSRFQAPALLTGEVFTSRGRNYLLPILFRIPQEQENLRP